MASDAADETLVDGRLASAALPVGDVEFIADLPRKHRRSREDEVATSTHGLRELIDRAVELTETRVDVRQVIG